MAEISAKEKTIASLYAELNRYGQQGEYERALKAANKIIGLAPQEFLAFSSKIVCLIHLSKFDDAMAQLNKNPQFQSKLGFEYAYCCYRANKYKEALTAIEALEKDQEDVDFRCQELKAQVLYRLEDFEKASTIYQDLIKNTHDDYEDERLTNLSASLVYLGKNSKEHAFRDSTYELSYNMACLQIASGNYTEAEKKLKQCEQLCRAYYEEDEITDEELDIELALFRIQLGYVYHKQGRYKEAHQLYSANLKHKLTDIALAAVASNNVVCINKDQNLFDSKKKMKVATNDQLIHRLPSQQRKFIALNNAIFHYYVNQAEQCLAICKAIETQWPDLAIYTSILKAMNLVKNNKVKEAIELLTKASSGFKKSNDQLFVQLCIAQFHLMQGNKLDACKVLESLGENSFRPAIVGALTTLYLASNDEATALKVFEKTVDFYRKNKVKSVDLSNLWRQAADFHIRSGHPEVAANSLEELLQTNKSDKKITAQLILACSQFNKKRAQALAQNLPSISELSKGLDLDNLQVISSSILSSKKSPVTASDQTGTPKTEEPRLRTRKHKKRKGKLPANYDSNTAPDPERWLPRYERSGYRKKRDRRVKDVIKGSQGTAGGSLQADQYDFSKYVEEGGTAPEASPSPASKNVGHFMQKKGQQKRKTKRR